ncbi:MAG TPA: GNAT family N-acetyltransferase [Herpetosiphonaceae bacterium]
MNEHLPHYAAAVDFLSRDPLANRELLLALRSEPVEQLQVARRDQVAVGVLIAGPGPFIPDPYWIRLDASDEAALDVLMQAFALTERHTLSIHRPWIGVLLRARYGMQPNGMGVYGYLLDRGQLVAHDHAQVRMLTPRDVGLVERSHCGWTRSYFQRLFVAGRRPWAIVQDGAIVCRASSGYPDAYSEEVVGVWTHPRWRGRGLARSLVSAVAADILERVSYAAYTTTYDNLSSQAVARTVGFRLCFAADSYQMRSHALANQEATAG